MLMPSLRKSSKTGHRRAESAFFRDDAKAWPLRQADVPVQHANAVFRIIMFFYDRLSQPHTFHYRQRF